MNKLPTSIQQFKQLVELKDYRPPTKAAYVRAVWKLVEHFDCEPSSLSEDQLRQYFLFLREEQQASPSVMKMTKWALRCYYLECVKVTGWTVFGEVRIAPVRTLPTVLARAEVQRLLAAVREPRFATSLRLMYYCGLRVGEVVRLEVTDIKGQETPPRLHIRNAKGGKDRFVPLFPALLAELRQWWCQHKNKKLLFPARPRGSERDPAVQAALRTTHRPLEAAAVQEAFRQARLDAGVTTAATTHTLRHSYATHLLESGVSLRQISAYLGHESLDTTAIYCHLTVATEARTQAVLAALYQPPKA